jgi:hypothetical protein
MKNLGFLRSILIFIVGCLIQVTNAYAAEIHAQSCSLEDVQAAIDTVQDGDTVTVPAGSCTWSDTLQLSREIEIIGAGIGQTTVAGHGFDVLDGTDNWRISGFTFVQEEGIEEIRSVIKLGGWLSSVGCRNFRIDNCRFEGETYVVDLLGWSTGVIDHNQFIKSVIECDGDNHQAWARETALGTSDFLFIEDNFFNNDGYERQHIITASRGARYVFRYNTIQESEAGIGNAVDSHGYCDGNEDRGVRAYEIYRNEFVRAVNGCCSALFLRGGTGVVYENTVDETGGIYFRPGHPTVSPIFLVDYRASDDIWNVLSTTCSSECSTSRWCDQDELYPCCDQIGRGRDQADDPLYFWGNVDEEGTLVAPVVPEGLAEYVQENRDYFNQQKPGYSSYTYPHPLAMPDDPDDPDENDEDDETDGGPDIGQTPPADGGETVGTKEESDCSCRVGLRTESPSLFVRLGFVFFYHW